MQINGLVALIGWMSWASWGWMIADGILEDAGPTISYNEAFGVMASGVLPWVFLAVGLVSARRKGA